MSPAKYGPKAISWGTLLPWGVAIANRTRSVSNGRPGAWSVPQRWRNKWVVLMVES